jgi:hypothetical protein
MTSFICTFPALRFAHAFGQRYELPIPLSLFVLAGAGVVLLSFFLVLRQGVEPVPELPASDQPPITPIAPLTATLSLVGLAGLLAAGFWGSQTIPENILPTWFWVVIWVGVALSCGLVGDWTQPLNPFANLSKIASKPQFRTLMLARTRPLDWPAWLGWWPAVGLFYAVVAGELIFNQTMTIPANLALALAAYAVICLTAGLIFGSAWLEQGEVFTVLFNTWGRLGYFRFGSPGRRGWLGGLDAPFAPALSRAVFILLLLASVSFDGLLSTPLWGRLQHNLPTSVAVGTVWYAILALLAFAVVTLLLWGLFSAFAVGVSRAGRHHRPPLQTLAGLLPSLLPISFGYLLAHYLQYILINGQLLFPLLGNPVGSDSWPIHLPYPFNDTFEPDPRVLSTGTAWYIAVAVIVIVHILAVILAHRHLEKTGRSKAAARRSEYPWIAAMVAYTMLSLWLLAQPLVKDTGPSPSSFTAPARQVAVK